MLVVLTSVVVFLSSRISIWCVRAVCRSRILFY